MPRIFLAIPVPENVHAQVRPLLPTDSALVYTPPENLHVTLHFQGPMTESLAETLVRGLSSEQTGAFELTLEGLGHFRISETRGVLWCGLRTCPELMQLHLSLTNQLRSLGIVPESRPWVPHITIARFDPRRFSAADALMQRYRKTCLGNFSVTEFRLCDSVPGPKGSQYNVLARYPL